MELTYTKVGDYYIPDLTAEPLPSRDLGKYGHMQLRYLQDHKSELHMGASCSLICWTLRTRLMPGWIG